MIHLIDDYYASVDGNCYTLLRENGTDKEGKKKYITLGYCGSLLETIKLLQRKSVKEDVYKRQMDIQFDIYILKDIFRHLFVPRDAISDGIYQRIVIIVICIKTLHATTPLGENCSIKLLTKNW